MLRRLEEDGILYEGKRVVSLQTDTLWKNAVDTTHLEMEQERIRGILYDMMLELTLPKFQDDTF